MRAKPEFLHLVLVISRNFSPVNNHKIKFKSYLKFLASSKKIIKSFNYFFPLIT